MLDHGQTWYTCEWCVCVKSWLISTNAVCTGVTSVCLILAVGMRIDNDNAGPTIDYGDLTKYNQQPKQFNCQRCHNTLLQDLVTFNSLIVPMEGVGEIDDTMTKSIASTHRKFHTLV